MQSESDYSEQIAEIRQILGDLSEAEIALVLEFLAGGYSVVDIVARISHDRDLERHATPTPQPPPRERERGRER